MNYLNSICDEIVSPPKLTYSAFDLGSIILQNGRRIDFNVTTCRNTILKCSLYLSICSKSSSNHNKSIRNGSQCCVVYLHSMNGSRLQSLPYLERILSLGYSFCSFDFSGCGNSTGESISFGANQKYDAHAVISELASKHSMKKIILWGRSMGAVCAIKYNQYLVSELLQDSKHEDIFTISGLILDSPFKSLKELFIQLGSRMSSLPSMLVKAGFFVIQGKLQDKGQFTFEQLQLQQSINAFTTPILFLASKQDITIPASHSQDLFTMYQHNQKQLKFINGLHNQSRDHEYIESVKNFIRAQFERKTIKPKKITSLFMRQLALKDQQIQEDSKNCLCSLFSNCTTVSTPKSSDRVPKSLSTKTPRSRISGQSITSIKQS